jgi:hypothetical protein
VISGFRIVRVPRVWDSPERRQAEKDPRDELGRLARSFKTALDEVDEEYFRARDVDPVLAATSGERSRSSPGSTISRRTTMTAARKQRFD